MNHEEGALFHASLAKHTLTGVEHHYHPVPIDGEYYTSKLICDHDDTRREETKKRRNHQQLYIPISISERGE